jgi:hypothetical protein
MTHPTFGIEQALHRARHPHGAQPSSSLLEFALRMVLMERTDAHCHHGHVMQTRPQHRSPGALVHESLEPWPDARALAVNTTPSVATREGA